MFDAETWEAAKSHCDRMGWVDLAVVVKTIHTSDAGKVTVTTFKGWDNQ